MPKACLKIDKTITTLGWIGAALCLFGIATFSLGGEPRRALGGALAAAAFGFAGIMWWGVRNGLRNNFDAKVGIKLDDIADEARQADRQLRLLQDRIARMSLADRFAGQGYGLSLVELAQLVEQPLAQLERRQGAWRWRDWMVEPNGQGRWRLRRADGGWSDAE